MSCGCDSGSGYDGGYGNGYNSLCNADTPYPSVSSESVPSLINNLTYALYGQIQKNVTNGQVTWTIPCDPNSTATINGIPRVAGEGLLCYIIRALNLSTPSGFVTVNGVQTLANKTLDATCVLLGNATTATKATNISGGLAGTVVYQTNVNTTGFTAVGTSGQVLLSNGTSAPTWSTNIAGNSGTATQLQTPRTLGISGDVTGTTSFDGSANATIAGTIANDAVTTAKIANGVVTAAKLGTNEQKQICKAWVNFNGTTPITTAAGTYTRSGTTITVTTPTNHNYSTGFNVFVTSATDSGLVTLYPSVVVVTVTSATQFTFTTASTGASSGSITTTANSIRSSYNVSSITKNGTGDYTINFATAMSDANYSVGASYGGIINPIATFVVPTYVTTAVRVVSTYYNGVTSGIPQDATFVSIQIFGN